MSLTEGDKKLKRKEIQKRYRNKNREKLRQKQNEYYQENKEEIKEKNKDRKKGYDDKYMSKNREKVLQRKKEYYQENKETIKEKQIIYQNEKRKTDIGFKIRGNLRGRLRVCLNPEVQMETTNRLISCSPDNFFQWLLYQFDVYMSWENYGTYWVLDHVKPLALFNLNNKKERLESMHWTNIRPFGKIDNIIKSDKYSSKIQHLHNIIVASFNFNFKLEINNEIYENRSKWTIRSEAS